MPVGYLATVQDLTFKYEWEPADGIAAPELAATWARLEIWVGDHCVTRVEDLESGSARRSIYCSLYPLAEWIAFNWWLLIANVRPGTFPARAHLWERHHNIRAAGDGFVWPDLVFLPQRDSTQVVWRADPSPRNGAPLRYITGGDGNIENAAMQRSMAGLVESVLARLEETRTESPSLEQEWQSIIDADQEEREFCVGAARLGLDPYSLAPETAAVLEGVADRIDPHLRDEFLGAVSPLRIQQDLDWVTQSAARIEHVESAPSPRLAYVRQGVRLPPRSPVVAPWLLGYQQADEVRDILDIELTQRVALDDLLDQTVHTSHDPALQGMGGFSRTGGGAVVAGIKSHKGPDVRFASTRGLWHFAYDPNPQRFLLTGGRADQTRTERAFAAELLAPAAGIEQLIPEDGGLVAAVDLDEIAEHFDVAPMVVRHQVENRLKLQVVD